MVGCHGYSYPPWIEIETYFFNFRRSICVDCAFRVTLVALATNWQGSFDRFLLMHHTRLVASVALELAAWSEWGEALLPYSSTGTALTINGKV